MIKDFFRRKTISSDAKMLVEKHFTTSEKRKLSTLTKDKAIRRIESLTNKLKQEAKRYKVEHELGVYGTAKLAKEIQSSLELENIDKNVINYVVNSIVRG
jgi:predicted metal-dependent hydrolase